MLTNLRLRIFLHYFELTSIFVVPAYFVIDESSAALYLNFTMSKFISKFPAGNYMFKVINRNTRTRREIYSRLTIKIPERWRRSGNFIVNFEHILHLALVFLLLTLDG